MAKKQGQGHSKLISWFGKTVGLLAILGIGAGVIYHIMPSGQKKLINQISGNQATQVERRAHRRPQDFTQALGYLHHDRAVPIQNVRVDVDGNVSGTINGQTVQKHLASIQTIGTNSRFYQQNATRITDLLNATIRPHGKASDTVQEAPDRSLYLFVDGKLFQQDWLARGLAYITVPRAHDNESTTLYTAQGNAQDNEANIWQVNQAVQGDPQHGYHFDGPAERNYLDNQKVSFSAQGQSTNFWGKITKALR